MRHFPLMSPFLVIAALAAPAFAGENITLEQLPPAVKATVQREVKTGQILEIERDQKKGQPIFEVEFLDAGVKWEIHVAPDGKLLSRKED
jgi:uncharacterized membrane protein YkoI